MLALLVATTCLAAEPLAPGDHERVVHVGGLDRSYLVHVPPGGRADRPWPVVLAFHGAAMNARRMAQHSGLSAKADAAGFVVAYPNGTGLGGALLAFNAGALSPPFDAGQPDDVAFVRALLDDLAGVLSLDERRVYATGLSNGGMFCYRLAAELADRIAAIAPVAGALALDDPRPARPVPVLHFHGTRDELVPWDGPAPRTPRFLRFRAVEETVRTWARLVGCPDEPATADLPDVADDGTRVRRRAYGPGRAGAEVILLIVVDGGHTWPGREPLAKFLGRTTRDIDANDLMWEFFARHRLPD